MDNVLVNKAAIIERCLKRIAEEYIGHENDLESDFTRQDSIILNLQRACEAAIDAAMHVVRVRRLGIPQQSRDAFVMLQEASLLDDELARRMQAMVGFRNVAVHNYRELSLIILRSILDDRLDDFRDFVKRLIALAEEEDA
ncbi:MAG: DUF86 domain-containing protein [Mariprofundaceae bacterium]